MNNIRKNNETGTPNGTWIFRPRPDPHTRLRLFCFPYAGGGVVPFYKWPESLPSGVELCAVRFPGRETRFKEPPITRVMPLVQKLAHILHPFLDQPFAFFGHSMGTRICFELARQFRKERIPFPAYLFVSGSRAPHLPDPDPPYYKWKDREFVEKLREFNGLPDEILHNAELMRLFLPALRADIEMFKTYVYSEEPPLECPISAFGGLSDPKICREHLGAWREHTRDRFRLLMLPGGHFFLNSARKELVEAISQDLEDILL